MASKWLLFSLMTLTWGCAKQEFGPSFTPAAQHPAYAQEYPAELSTETKLSQIEQGIANESPTRLEALPGEPVDPDWDKIEKIYRLAAEDGKSEHYARVKAENTTLAEFFVEEKKDLVGKISGGVHYQAKKENCDSQFYGSIDRGFEKGVKERFEEREEASSQAQIYITEHQEALGKKNIAPLREQARLISAAAHLAFVSLPSRHARIKELVRQAKEVESTLEQREKQLAQSRSANESPQEKEARNAERVAIEEAKGSLQSAVSSAQKRLETSEQEARRTQQEFESAFEALLKRTIH